MNKNLPLIVGAVVIVGLVVGGWLFLGKGKPEVSAPAEVAEEAPAEQKEESFTGKIKEAVLRGIPMKCVWKDDRGNSTTGYIKGKKYYAEVISEGRTGYLIMKDNCMWTWSKGESQGVKMCLEPTEEEEGLWEMEGSPQEAYNCAPAAVSDSLFNPPANVNFMDMSQMMQMGE